VTTTAARIPAFPATRIKPRADYLTEAGARRLCERIEQAWHQLGYHDLYAVPHFDSAGARQASGIRCAEFGIKADDECWRLELTSVHGLPFKDETAAYADRIAITRRLAEELPRLAVLNSAAMFSPHCLLCGKELTDPASMARLIGPECAGTGSLDAGMFRLTESAPAEDNSIAADRIVDGPIVDEGQYELAI
jgi:hypothetical protein